MTIPSVEPPDPFMLVAQLRGVPAGWRWFSSEKIDGSFLVTGAVCTATYASGPKKGQENWTRRDRATERRLVITVDEMEHAKGRWETEHNLCAGCGGSARETTGWSETNGVRTGPCRRCRGKGTP